MTKILVVGDIHHGPNLEQIEALIEQEQPNITVFLGDYFDQFFDHFDHAKRTALWLKQSLSKPNRVHLLGNHDISYRFSGYMTCPGYDPAKERAIRSVIDDNEWAKMKLWYLEGQWLFTHAGLSLPYGPTNIANLRNYMIEEEKAAWSALKSRNSHWIWSIGRARGGAASVGGIIWCDWSLEFLPIPGVNQIVGHTPDTDFRVKRGDQSENWCIDVSCMNGVHKILCIENDKARPLAV